MIVSCIDNLEFIDILRPASLVVICFCRIRLLRHGTNNRSSVGAPLQQNINNIEIKSSMIQFSKLRYYMLETLFKMIYSS